jgi:WD40 repeat protein
LTAPVSLLLILFSLTLASTIAYTYSLNQIENRKEDLKLYAAEEKMLDLEEAISGVAWSPGSTRTLAFSDYGGQLRVEPSANHLQLNVTMGASTYTLFDSDTGRFVYELPSTVVGHLGRWLRGDERSIVNQSSAYQAMMWVETGDEHEELIARYRPLASSSLGDLISERRVNNIRVYVVNLNASQPIGSGGEFHVKVVCDNVTTRVSSYDLDSSITDVSVTGVTAELDGVERTVVLPLTVGPSGSTVRVEVVVSHVKIEGVRI